jgi:hypothetical protein
VLWAVKEKGTTGRRLTFGSAPATAGLARCAKVEHVFRVMKCQFGYGKFAIAASP